LFFFLLGFDAGILGYTEQLGANKHTRNIIIQSSLMLNPVLPYSSTISRIKYVQQNGVNYTGGVPARRVKEVASR
jgi:hypothetical protein